MSVKRLILWLDNVDWVIVTLASLMIAMGAFLVGGMGLASWRCGCDAIGKGGPVLSSSLMALGAGFAGWGFCAHGWPRLVAWAARSPQKIAPIVSGDPLLREAEAEVERILEGGGAGTETKNDVGAPQPTEGTP